MFENPVENREWYKKIARIHIIPMKFVKRNGIAVKFSGFYQRISQFHLYVSQNIATVLKFKDHLLIILENFVKLAKYLKKDLLKVNHLKVTLV